ISPGLSGPTSSCEWSPAGWRHSAERPPIRPARMPGSRDCGPGIEQDQDPSRSPPGGAGREPRRRGDWGHESRRLEWTAAADSEGSPRRLQLHARGGLIVTKALRWRIIALQVVLVVVLGFCAGFLYWGSSFVNGMVHDQLVAQKIYFPAKGSSALDPKEFP